MVLIRTDLIIVVFVPFLGAKPIRPRALEATGTGIDGAGIELAGGEAAIVFWRQMPRI